MVADEEAGFSPWNITSEQSEESQEISEFEILENLPSHASSQSNSFMRASAGSGTSGSKRLERGKMLEVHNSVGLNRNLNSFPASRSLPTAHAIRDRDSSRGSTSVGREEGVDGDDEESEVESIRGRGRTRKRDNSELKKALLEEALRSSLSQLLALSSPPFLSPLTSHNPSSAALSSLWLNPMQSTSSGLSRSTTLEDGVINDLFNEGEIIDFNESEFELDPKKSTQADPIPMTKSVSLPTHSNSLIHSSQPLTHSTPLSTSINLSNRRRTRQKGRRASFSPTRMNRNNEFKTISQIHSYQTETEESESEAEEEEEETFNELLTSLNSFLSLSSPRKINSPLLSIHKLASPRPAPLLEEEQEEEQEEDSIPTESEFQLASSVPEISSLENLSLSSSSASLPLLLPPSTVSSDPGKEGGGEESWFSWLKNLSKKINFYQIAGVVGVLALVTSNP